MPVFNIMFPVLPGKEDDARKFAEEATGSHRKHFEGVQKANSLARQTWAMQETPGGTFILVWGEVDEAIEASFGRMATATGEDFDWMRGRIKDISGVDMTEPGGPIPEVILDWSA